MEETNWKVQAVEDKADVIFLVSRTSTGQLLRDSITKGMANHFLVSRMPMNSPQSLSSFALLAK
jgi:hypothetical protein